MNYFIDFDGTLYDTAEFKKDMLNAIAKTCHKKNRELQYENILFDVSAALKIGLDINGLCEYMANKYHIEKVILDNAVNNVLDDGKKYIYEDSIPYLLNLKKEGHNLCMLTYSAQSSVEFQKRKIIGSGLDKLFDKIEITTKPKGEFKTDYKNAVFVDDNPKELLGLCQNNPAKVIRIKRANGKYSNIPLDAKVEETTNLFDLFEHANSKHNMTC
ncbi:MAG: HAD family hydrolase [Clostridia bacterium]|nr:HAD family hydrolase [Clostridia bacterium]